MYLDIERQIETTTISPVAKVLYAAADLIERDGWCQCARYHDGRRCALGAIYRYPFPAKRVGMHLAVLALEAVVGDVVDWNDHPERTAAEVITKLREVATDCQRRGE